MVGPDKTSFFFTFFRKEKSDSDDLILTLKRYVSVQTARPFGRTSSCQTSGLTSRGDLCQLLDQRSQYVCCNTRVQAWYYFPAQLDDRYKIRCCTQACD